MPDQHHNERHAKWKRYMQGAFIIGVLVILGSCVYRIDSAGGGHNANRKMATIFFFHLFLIVPCLFGLFVYAQVKLEKYFLNRDRNQEERVRSKRS